MADMNTLIDDEKFIRKSFLSDDIIFNITCNLFLLHFKAVDFVEHTAHCRTINFLYRSKNLKLTKQGIAAEIYSNVKTLKIAREKYTAYFNYFYEYIKSRNLTAETAIAFLY